MDHNAAPAPRGRITDAPPRALGALVSLSTAAFCYVAMETLPIGILPLISADLHVSATTAGLLLTSYAVTVAVISMPLAYITQRIPRRPLMAALLAVLTVATLVCAAAGDFQVLLWSRIVIAVTQALFWAVVAPAAAGMFPVHVRGRVTSVVFGGAALAPMAGVPAGTWLGQQAGWRTAFVALAILALLACAAVVTLMPGVAPGQGHAATGSSPDVRRYLIVLVATALAVTGLFSAFTYTAVFLTDVTGIPAAAISVVLLARGVADFAGIAAGGIASDRHQRLALGVPIALLAVSMFGMYVFAGTAAAVVALLALSGFAMGALTPALSNRVLEVAPGSSDLASAGQSAAFNVGIAAGSYLGGVVLPSAGVRATALAGGIAAAAALLTVLAEPLIAGPRAAERSAPN
ncbi:MFS transporter [Nonomuraea sp. SBT364]|uniref:MFS transporter n=1 Tax=Nonomuraea sp. SBT364 TaxID=1580530 RepID=UPI0012E182DA|nr:MFS transporter [Nonomuraea sp. SBT364]